MITVSATVLHSAVLVLYINVMLDRLLQRCASWRTVRHCSETAASSEQRSLSKCRGVSTPSRYCTSCIGCRSSSGSYTIWQFWHTKFGARLHRSIYTAESESQNAIAAELYVQVPFRCWTSSWEQTSLSVLSGFQHRLSGTATNSSHQWFSDSF